MSQPLTPSLIVETMHQAFRDRDLDRIATFWADDIHFIAPGVDVVGKEARISDEKTWLDAFSDNFIQVEAVWAIEDEVVEFCVMGGVHSGPLVLPDGTIIPPTGRRIAGPFVSRYRILDGRVVRQHIVYDRQTLSEQLFGELA